MSAKRQLRRRSTEDEPRFVIGMAANLKRMLNEAGCRAEVVRSDTIANKERKRRICDIVDAENLALAYIKGDIDEFVWTPSDRYTEYRDIMFAYRDTSKEVTRISNRIWSVCSRKGYKLPIKSQQTKALSRLRRPEVTHPHARRASFSTTSFSNFQQGS